MSSQVFRPAFGNRPDKIIGRDDVMSDFLKGLDSAPGSRERSTLFAGQRGMGKTALLLELETKATEMGFVVARVTAGTTMLEEIIELIQLKGAQYVKREHPKVKGFNAGALGFSVGLTFSEEANENFGFRVKLGLLCEKLAEEGHGVLVLIDEVQSASEDLQQFAKTYQSLIGEGKNIAVGMAGLPSSVSQMLNEKTLTFLNRAHKVELGSISLVSIRIYYANVFSSMGKTWTNETLEKAVQETRGFPYLMQLLGYYLVEFTRNVDEIDDTVFEQARISAHKDLIDAIYAPVLSSLSDKDRDFLDAMALDNTTSKVADIKARLGAADNQMQPYRARLIEAQVIASPRRGELEFSVPYLGEYLRSLQAD